MVKLARLAFAEWEARVASRPALLYGYVDDPVLYSLQVRQSFWTHALELALSEAVDTVFSDPAVQSIAPTKSDLVPMILLPDGGGLRMPPRTYIAAMITFPLVLGYLLKQKPTPTSYVAAVCRALEELRTAVRGEDVSTYLVSGIVGISIDPRLSVTMPWGILRAAPDGEIRSTSVFPKQSNCILVEKRKERIKFDRSKTPDHTAQIDEGSFDRQAHLLSLACALASPDSSQPVVALAAWHTRILPFGGSLEVTIPPLPHMPPPVVDITEIRNDLRRWARIVRDSHHTAIAIAERRLVSAIAHRRDADDRLIDAVTVWENLVGSRTETTFKVTLAITKMLESDITKRRALQSQLSKIYNARSDVVHGTPTKDNLDERGKQAIDIAIRALRCVYRQGADFIRLNGEERFRTVILDWR